MQYGDLGYGSSIPFYTHRHVWIYNGRVGTNLELGSKFADAPPTFLDDATFPALWNGPVTVFLLVPEELAKGAFSRLPHGSSYLLQQYGGKYVFVNREVRQGMPTLEAVLQSTGRSALQCSSGKHSPAEATTIGKESNPRTTRQSEFNQ